ncbi:MAG: hypothetical protein EBR82_18230 [Caulobacteraceae bacterium]|nr:hypothetical protein [Caulobacteraceae bacterium]
MSLVCGTGVPVKPCGLPDAVSTAWDWIERMAAGVVFEQDGWAIQMAAEQWVRHGEYERLIADNSHDMDEFDRLVRAQLAVDRQLNALFDRLGLNPKARQTLRVPRESVSEPDEFERMLGGG